MISPHHTMEVRSGERFPFGKNWNRFLMGLTDDKIVSAVSSLKENLQIDSLPGKRFLDAGSGSGLFSLAARRLGATVHSFDYDPQSVACTRQLKERYFKGDFDWTVEEGSVLDDQYLTRLGKFDVVYSWGVLHHTGNMHRAFANVIKTVAPNGRLFISIYNDQGWFSRYWSFVKRSYNKNKTNKLVLVTAHAPYLFFGRFLARTLNGRSLQLERGMSLWPDMIDWLGGYPFEYAKPEEVFQYFRTREFTLERLKTCGGRCGCNEFVFLLDRDNKGVSQCFNPGVSKE